LAAAISAAGCGGGGGNPGTGPAPGPTPATLQIAGQYQITQTAVSDTCGQTGTPAAVSATVTHDAGGTTFTMRDTGGTTFTGTVERNGDFTSTAVFGPDAGGQTYSQRLTGRFTASGFTGTLVVDQQPRNCTFTRSWSATKQGTPNVIP
jgi:hypothetical protein